MQTRGNPDHFCTLNIVHHNITFYKILEIENMIFPHTSQHLRNSVKLTMICFYCSREAQVTAQRRLYYNDVIGAASIVRSQV